ncbi:unnamed protein product [Plutella xylostella]|uniref:(diamondback moth) hypothetical protein n=1 Tax=Plutella xylostella TaxID=51655 RepID=A0A8S4EV14_PLUXY|nr:unnamed protein product [Plutella xylostella]
MAVFWGHFVLLCILPTPLVAHSPESSEYYHGWAEPDFAAPSYPIVKVATRERVAAAREDMSSSVLAAYIIPNADAHRSTYLSEADARFEWICGLSVPSGTAVVTATDALVWTDKRYSELFHQQVDTELWTLMTQDNLTLAQWLLTIPGHPIIGLHPTTVTSAEWSELESALATGDSFILLGTSLVDAARNSSGELPPCFHPLLPLGVEYTASCFCARRSWTPLGTAPGSSPRASTHWCLWGWSILLCTSAHVARGRRQEQLRGAPPALPPAGASGGGVYCFILLRTSLLDAARNYSGELPPRCHPLLPLGVEYTGRRASEKISDLMTQIRNRGAKALLITALDEVAYTLNLRGSDIPYNPVFFAYLIIRVDTDDSVILFWSQGELSPDVVQHLAAEGVSDPFVLDYRNINMYIDTYASMLEEGELVWWLSNDTNRDLYEGAENDGKNKIATFTNSPVALMKMVKNEVELKGFQSAHIKDGVAVVRALRWVESQVRAGVQVTEVELSDKLDEMRAEESDYMGPSFATSVAAGANAAIPHYIPSREGEQTVVGADDMLLVDSGGHYKHGTTDVTRTRHMSSCSAEQRETFTRVLKGQLALATAVFPRGVKSNALDTLARHALWRRGLDYAHGTGHGVGHFLNVHEGPNRISAVSRDSDVEVEPGMVFSIEPGYYKVGEYGIRHEDMVEVVEVIRDSDHPRVRLLT